MAAAQEYYRVGEAFDIPDFKQFSLLAQDEIVLPTLQFDARDAKLTAGSSNRLYNDGLISTDLELPPLEDHGIDHLSSLDGESELSYADEDLQPLDIVRDATEPVEDVWQISKDLPPLNAEPRLLSWQNFTNPYVTQTRGPAYMSEAGSAVFDAALANAAQQSASFVGAGRPIQVRPLLKSLSQLGLGRASIFFRWDEEDQAFKQVLKDDRPSGYSLDCSQSMIESVLRCGSMYRNLQTLVEKTRSRPDQKPVAISLSGVIDTILTAIDEHISGAETLLPSLLQVQSAFEPVHVLLGLAQELANSVKNARTDKDMMNRLMETLCRYDNYTSATVGVCRQILQRVTWHFFRNVERCVGLGSSSGLDMHLQQLKQLSHAEDDLSIETAMGIPDFVMENEKQLIGTTLRCLAYLQDHQSEHPLISPSEIRVEAPSIVLQFHWQDLERLQRKADEYQRSVVQALADASAECGQADNETLQQRLCDASPDAVDLDFDIFDQEPQYGAQDSHKGTARKTMISNELLRTVSDFLKMPTESSNIPGSHDDEILREATPPLSLVSSLSLHPILITQHDLLSYSALHCILHKHDLVSHFHMHHRFSLFGSGLFVARLRNVLFSDETESTERRRNVLRTGGSASQGAMGLHLGSSDRQQWPPASSEVRLALMNVLIDVWQEEATFSLPDRPSMPSTLSNTMMFANSTLAPTNHSADVSSSISFTIRTNLPEDSITKILNPHSIYALDFLALTYTPPAALLPLFAPRVLAHYDRIFTFQIRLLRVSASLANLHKHTRTFAQQQKNGRHYSLNSSALRLHHAMLTFHNTFLTHVRHAAIDTPWNAFLSQLHDASAACRNPIPPASRSEAQPQSSLDALAALHESMLRRILGGLLLRKKQARALEALEGVWGMILEAEVRLGSLVTGENDGTGEKGAAKEMGMDLFEEKKLDFVRRCEELVVSGRKDQAGGEDAEVLGVLEDLVVVLKWDYSEKGMVV